MTFKNVRFGQIYEILTLRFLYQAFWFSRLIPGESAGPPAAGPHCCLKNRCPNEHEILYDIRDIYEHLRNVNVSHIMIK